MIRIVFLNSKNKYNRTNGPAIIDSDSYILYYVNNKLHRENGPALTKYDDYKSYYLKGIYYSKKEYYEKLKH